MSELPWSSNQIMLFFVILCGGLLSLAGSIVTVGKAVETVRGWRKPKTDLLEKVAAHEKRLCDGNVRFEQQDRMIGGLQEGQRVLCVGIQALLESAVYGNNTEGIRGAHNELKAYLADGVGGKN